MEYAKDVLVDTDWVAQNLNTPGVRLIEVDEDILLYDTGHIPGAVKVDWQTDFWHPVERDFIGPDEVAALLVAWASDLTIRSFCTVTRATGGRPTRTGSCRTAAWGISS